MSLQRMRVHVCMRTVAQIVGRRRLRAILLWTFGTIPPLSMHHQILLQVNQTLVHARSRGQARCTISILRSNSARIERRPPT